MGDDFIRAEHLAQPRGAHPQKTRKAKPTYMVITKVSWMEMDGPPPWELHSAEIVGNLHEPGEHPRKAAIKTESIGAHRFRHPTRNIDVCIGVSNQAGEAIGLMYDAIDAQLTRSSELYREVINLRNELRRVESASFLRRLKWLFCGYNGAKK